MRAKIKLCCLFLWGLWLTSSGQTFAQNATDSTTTKAATIFWAVVPQAGFGNTLRTEGIIFLKDQKKIALTVNPIYYGRNYEKGMFNRFNTNAGSNNQTAFDFIKMHGAGLELGFRGCVNTNPANENPEFLYVQFAAGFSFMRFKHWGTEWEKVIIDGLEYFEPVAKEMPYNLKRFDFAPGMGYLAFFNECFYVDMSLSFVFRRAITPGGANFYPENLRIADNFTDFGYNGVILRPKIALGLKIK